MTEKASILYVDDEELNLVLFKSTFEDMYSVITANSGLKGLETINSNPVIKAVISDMKMPSMNGIEFLSRVKDLKPDIPCYILTGYDLNDDIAAAIKKGIITKFFRKPFNVKDIDTTIQNSLH